MLSVPGLKFAVQLIADVFHVQLYEESPLVLVELAPAVATWNKRKQALTVFMMPACIWALSEPVYDCVDKGGCVFNLHLTEQDGDADETKDSS